MEIKDLIKKIQYNNGRFPRKEIQEIIERKEEAIPELMKVLEDVLDNPEKYIEDGNYFTHIYAIYLLAQFRTEGYYELLIKILRLPNEMPHDLFGDTITEAAGRIIATICGDDIQPIKGLSEDSGVDEYVRGSALRALVILVLQNRLKREEVLEYFKYLLNGGLKDQHSYVLAEVVVCCDYLYPEELYDDIRKAFEKDLIADGIIDLDYIKNTLRSDKDEVLEDTKYNLHMQLIDDTIKELEWWACFYKDYEEKQKQLKKLRHKQRMSRNTTTIVKGKKIGRNEPCPCGSGKKYKKCCGKN